MFDILAQIESTPDLICQPSDELRLTFHITVQSSKVNDGWNMHLLVQSHSYSCMCAQEKLGEMTMLDAGDKTGCVKVCRGRG